MPLGTKAVSVKCYKDCRWSGEDRRSEGDEGKRGRKRKALSIDAFQLKPWMLEPLFCGGN